MKINKNQTNNFTQNSKAQGAIEYLLIIGAAIIVVAIVVILISGLVTTNQGTEAGLQSGYTGLGDILDASQNRVTFKLSLKPSEVNTIEFSSIEQDNSLWAMFSSLPLGTTVEFTAVNNCIGNSDEVDATKTPNAFMQGEENANACLVPINGAIRITLPDEVTEEVDVDVKVEIDEEPFILLDTIQGITDLLTDNSNNYKLNIDDDPQIDAKINNFTGILSADYPLIISTTLDCIFTGNKPKIENITFYNNTFLSNIEPNCQN